MPCCFTFFKKNLIKNLLGRPFKDFGKLITPKIHNSNYHHFWSGHSAFISQIFNLKKQQHLWYQIAILSMQMAVLEQVIFTWYEILSIQSNYVCKYFYMNILKHNFCYKKKIYNSKNTVLMCKYDNKTAIPHKGSHLILFCSYCFRINHDFMARL